MVVLRVRVSRVSKVPSVGPVGLYNDSLKKALIPLAAATSSYFHAGSLHVPFRLFTVPFRLFTTCGLACGSPTVLRPVRPYNADTLPYPPNERGPGSAC